jgi:hypothetical protein
MALSFKGRRDLLIVFTGLVVAFVRNVVQYRRYTFDGGWDFFGSWFVHYLAVALGMVLFSATSSSW